MYIHLFSLQSQKDGLSKWHSITYRSSAANFIPLASRSIFFPVDNWLTYRTLLHLKMYLACFFLFFFQFFLFNSKLLDWFLNELIDSWIISVKLLLQPIHPWLFCFLKITARSDVICLHTSKICLLNREINWVWLFR